MGIRNTKTGVCGTLAVLLALGASTAAEASYISEVADLRLVAIPTAMARNGAAVANLGDINGDGFADLAVGTPGEDLAGTAPGAGAISVFVGDPIADRPGPNSILRAFGAQAGEAWGSSIAGVGDLNGDGLDDFVVGAPGWDPGGTQDVGRVTVHFGQASGLPPANAEIRGSQSGSRLGAAVAGAGDVNGDGYADLILGAPTFDDAGRVDSGQVQLFFGGPGAAFDTVPDATLAPTAAQSRFGASLASAGDFNGDGFSDIVIGVPNATVGESGEGAALLYLGGAGAFNTLADAAFESNQAGAALGTSVAGGGDVNGDGFADVVLGAPLYDDGQSSEGAVFVFHGSAVVNAVVDAIVQQDIAGALYGTAVALADTNGDGYADLAAGAPLATDFGIAEFGLAWIRTGAAAGLGAENYRIRGQATTTSAGRFGSALAFVDYNGDGYPELFVGAPDESGGAGRDGQGYSYLVRSGVRLAATIDDTKDGTQSGAQLGHAMATGDINRDGLADIAVGLPNFDTGTLDVGRVEVYYGIAGGFNTTPDIILNGNTLQARFGRAIAIGDFNGDSFGDIAVGAPVQTTNGGEVHIFHGGPGVFDTTVDRILSIAQVGAMYGEVVANVGDLDGDGLVELGIGAPLADIGGATDSGVVYVYSGSSSGIGPLPRFEVQSVTTQNRLGMSLVGAGDVNGDGFADLAFGERGTSTQNRGAVRVLFGGSPLDGQPDQSINFSVNNANCAQALAPAGDVNGDGYSDLLVGCPDEDTAVLSTGAVRVLRGSPTGLVGTAAFVGAGPASASLFGRAVAGGADLDGDGYADIVVGMPGRSQGANTGNGALRWYRGSANGIVAASATELSVPENNARFGSSVLLADLNGDGFAEIVSGAPGATGSAADVGAFHVTFANAVGRNTSAQQFRNATTPLDFQGDSQSDGSFFAVVDGLSPNGRERARLQVQACPSGVPFGNAACVDSVSASWQDLGTVPGSAVLVGNPGGLADGSLNYWRARLQFAPLSVTQPGITAPANPARVGPWRRMRANADVAEIRVQDRLFRDSFE